MHKGVLKYVFQSNPSLRVLAMSASFCRDEQQKFASIVSVQPTEIMWGSMARRGIIFDVSVLGVVTGSLCNEIVFYLKHKPTHKAILYTNTKSSAKGHLLTLVKKAMVTRKVDGDAIPGDLKDRYHLYLNCHLFGFVVF